MGLLEPGEEVSPTGQDVGVRLLGQEARQRLDQDLEPPSRAPSGPPGRSGASPESSRSRQIPYASGRAEALDILRRG
jgi:hypothetical protein